MPSMPWLRAGPSRGSRNYTCLRLAKFDQADRSYGSGMLYFVACCLELVAEAAPLFGTEVAVQSFNLEVVTVLLSRV